MKVVVTGAAGFIGANVVAGLNRLGVDEVIAVDDLTEGAKYRNLVGLRISDYFDQAEFYTRFFRGDFGRIDAVLHQGACSDTTISDGRFMLETNYRCSKNLLDACLAQGCRFIYASSAAIYGRSGSFKENPECEAPLNVYGFSKLLFDQIVRRRLSDHADTQIIGLRYFNVYGPREQHKSRMASVAFHHQEQLRKFGHVRLFGEYGGYGAGKQERDFVYVDDVVKVIMWFFKRPHASGIFNVGTGRAQTFNDIARATINSFRAQAGEHALSLDQIITQGLIQYIPFPEDLKGKYQCHTQADLSKLRDIGCDLRFVDVSTGIRHYIEWASGHDEQLRIRSDSQ